MDLHLLPLQPSANDWAALSCSTSLTATHTYEHNLGSQASDTKMPYLCACNPHAVHEGGRPSLPVEPDAEQKGPLRPEAHRTPPPLPPAAPPAWR